MKSKGKLPNRLPTLHLLNSIGTVIEDWSLDGDPFVIDKSLNKLVPKPNLRSFAEKPEITKADWLSALEWNKKGNKKAVVKIICKEQGILYFSASGDKSKLSKEECREYLKNIDSCSFKTFDEMTEYVNSIRLIEIDVESWQLSKCTCWFWLKNFKCNHVIAISTRLSLCNFSSIIMVMPLEKKRKPGRKPLTKPALMHQSLEQT